MPSIIRFLAISALTAVGVGGQKSGGCGRNLPDGQQNGGRYNATVGDRRYVVNVPDDYANNTPSPLILSFHGGNNSPEQQIKVDRLTLQVKSNYPDLTINIDDVFYVYPAGTSKEGCEEDNSCGKLWWSVDPVITADDVGFVDSILDSLEETYCLDLDRFYATGMSQGGGLTNKLACDSGISKRIAAFAPASGAYYTDIDTCEPPYDFDLDPFCSPDRPGVPILASHGKKDGTISFDGDFKRGQCLPSIPHWAEQWAERDGLSTDVEEWELTPTTTVYEYGGGLVTLIVDDNMGHVWPNNGSAAPFAFTPLLLRFFDKQTLS